MLMVPHCEGGTRRIYYISYVREQAILFFIYKIEKEEKKRLSYTEQMIELVQMYFIDRKKRENKRQNKLHLFGEKKPKTQEKKKNLSFFFARNFWGHFFFFFFSLLIRYTPSFSLSSSMASFFSSWPTALVDRDISAPKVHT